ncbi:MAG TPA: phosphatidylglycerol lysyltransferase domain-containing protein [Gaiellaceae bacterium]|jgi:lysyl-tRNA synthetase class 2
MLRRTVSLPLALAVVVAASGWLYVVRPALDLRPLVGEALPLDELARHSTVPFLLFVVVWAVAAGFLGAIARWARMERLVAAVLLAIGVGVWQYAQTAFAIAVVRQVSAQAALDAASHVEAVYLPAALAGVAGALLALPRRRRHRAPLLVATLVAVAGGLDLVHAMLPGENEGLVRTLTPDAVGPLARASGALVGLALLVAARGLARRRCRAWRVALACAALSSTLHVLHGLNDGTLASTVVLLLLVARRHDFDGPGDEETKHLVLARGALVVTAIAAYGTAALWVNQMAADQPLSARFVVSEIGAGVLGLHASGSPHLAGFFGDWYPLSLLLLALAGTAWVVAGWIAPWRHRVRSDARERGLARELVRAWGSDTLAPFVLRRDKAYFFGGDERAFLAYRVVHGVAIVSGDPIGPPELLPALVDAFVRHARERAWRVAVLGASERHLDLYRAHGLHALYHGDEAIVETASFSLEGRPIRKVRQSVHRLQAAGYTVRLLAPGELDGARRAELEAILRDWRGGAPERGFAMALDALFSLGDDEAVFAVGLDPAGRAAGFLHFAVSRPGSALSLSSMPRLASTPNGFNEWLIVETVAWARDHGYARVSLNFAPFAALLAPEAVLTPSQELQRRALLALKGHFQLDNLLLFNRKFFPQWERRFVVFEHRRDLPRVGIAALAAEAYLPFGGGRK